MQVHLSFLGMDLFFLADPSELPGVYRQKNIVVVQKKEKVAVFRKKG